MFFKNTYKDFSDHVRTVIKPSVIIEASKPKTIADVQKAKIKIKSTTPTPGGIYYEFFTDRSANDASEILGIKSSRKTIFIKGE